MSKNSFISSLIVVTIFLLSTTYLSAPVTPSWSYIGETGSDHWGRLDHAFSKCAEGMRQSPINIRLSQVNRIQSIEDMKVNYLPTVFTISNNGHTIQANPSTNNNSIIVEGKEYTLQQLHFHKPSEHQINGMTFAMEGHLVHQTREGDIAVVGFFIKAGKENKELAKMWAKLPKLKTKEDIMLDKPMDLVHLLPKVKKYFLYDGSLTTPPCTERVNWVIFEAPIELSKVQIEAFRWIFPDNHRPVQPLNKRQVVSN